MICLFSEPLLPATNVKFSFERSQPKFYLINPDDKDTNKYEIVFDEMELVAPIASLEDGPYKELLNKLKAKDAEYW